MYRGKTIQIRKEDEGLYILRIRRSGSYFFINETLKIILIWADEGMSINDIPAKLKSSYGISQKNAELYVAKAVSLFKVDLFGHSLTRELKTPLRVSWKLTSRCNLKCKHCYVSCTTESQDTELSVEQCMNIINKLDAAEIFDVSITGGEIFVRDDIKKIIVTFASMIACILLRWKAMESETKCQQEQIKLSNLYSEEYNALVEISRKKQHDFKNQINALYGLSDIKAEKEQRKYIDKLLDENKVVKILHSVEQPVLAGFLYRKVNEIMAAGINIEFNLSVPDAELAIEVLDCIEIVGIFLDNAVEALNKEKDKSIILEMFTMEQKVEIRVKNVSPYYENDEISKFFQYNYSTKGKNRGIGLAKIKDLQKKYKFDILVEMQEIHNKNWISFSVIK